MKETDSRNELVNYYASSYRDRFHSKEAAEAHFATRFTNTPVRFRSLLRNTLGKLWLVSCMTAGAGVLVGYDIEKIRETVSTIRSDDHSVAIFLDEKTLPLFKPDALAKHQICLKRYSQTCFITLQDVRTHPEMMVNPDTHLDDVCGHMYRPEKYFGTKIEYEFKTTMIKGKEATRCVVKNKEELQKLEALEFWRPAAATALNVLGIIGMILL